MALWAEETWINATKGHGIGESGVRETCYSEPGALFRACQREHGRCVGKVYVDNRGKGDLVRTVGWVFVKRARYQDSKDTYLAETWVTVHERPPTITRTDHYAKIGA